MTDSFSRNNYPQQVSVGQSDQDRSEIAFSNGASFSSIAENDGHFLEHGIVRNGILNDTETRRQWHGAFNGTIAASNLPVIQPRHPEYEDYGQRLRSYARWIRSNPGPVCLCDAGLFFTNQCDLVRCFQCGIGLKDFSEGDDPLFEHVRYSVDCPYLLQHLGTARLSALKSQCQAQGTGISQPPQNNEQFRHPEYQTFEARVSSFRGWPSYLSQSPRQLAEAGLYFTGFEDQVRCFACDGGLRRWDQEDDPWTEHCRWFPVCPFAIQQKGYEFISLVQASAEFNEQNTSNEEGAERPGLLGGAMDQMTIRDQEIKQVLDQHKNTCLEMGYDVAELTEAVQDLRNMGTLKPTVEEIVDMIEVVKERKLVQQRINDIENHHRETPQEENLRLKSVLTCMSCNKNNVNVLFIPCTHHRMCMECAEKTTDCPVCHRNIRRKIRTYLV